MLQFLHLSDLHVRGKNNQEILAMLRKNATPKILGGQFRDHAMDHANEFSPNNRQIAQ